MEETKQVKVGVGVFVINGGGKFLVQKRHGAHGQGTWSLPGGHLEFGEEFSDTAIREVREETGMQVDTVRFVAVTNDIFESEHKQYVTIWVACDWVEGEPINMEPEKCLEQRWVTFDELPEPLFLPWRQLFASEFFPAIKQLTQNN